MTLGDRCSFLLLLSNTTEVDKSQIINLIDKYLEGKSSAEEEQVLIRFFDSFRSEEISDEETRNAIQAQLEEKMLNRLFSSICQKKIVPQKNVKFYSLPMWKFAAAAITLMLTAGLLYYNLSPAGESRKNFAAESAQLAPGKNKALLKLGDGSVIELNNASNGVLAMQGSTAVKKTKDGQLIYVASQTGRSIKNTLNTITTPKGGQYQLTLPDGTKVWLNAASSLTFPTVFDSLERRVTLRGEAYFEVAKIYISAARAKVRMPFFVKTAGSQVEVLGTHFNIMAYADAITQETTLLEGSVVVKHGQDYRKIVPGQQATIVNGSNTAIKVKEANTDLVMAWKEGLFLFDDSNIDEAMLQIGRWYNAEIIYQGPKPDAEFTGVLPRSSNLTEVLSLLESAQGVKFSLNGNKIIVQKK